MSDMVDVVRLIVPAFVIPVGVFAANWALRYKRGYTQTAASDFILAVLIFDGTVITTSKEFEPFIRNEVFRQIAIDWHVSLGFVGCFLWWLITTFGEPVIANYYHSRRLQRPSRSTFAATLMICWMAVFILVSVHVLFFIWRGGPHD